jgi:hypothetical protein
MLRTAGPVYLIAKAGNTMRRPRESQADAMV